MRKSLPVAPVQRFVGLPVRSNGHSSGWISVFSKIQPLGQVSPTVTAHFWSLSAGAPRVSAHLRQRAIVKDHHVQPRKPPIARNNHQSRSSMKAPTNNTPRIMTTAGMFTQSHPTSNARQTDSGLATGLAVEDEVSSFTGKATQRLS